jgi:adenosine kinase
VAERLGGLDLVLIGADDPAAMVRHTDECRSEGYAFAADPSQQLARMHRDEIRSLVEGATFLFTNEYEAALTEQKTGWSSGDLLDKVEVRVTTLGARGCLVERRGEQTARVESARELGKADPTGVGDAFRAGFLAGVAWGLTDERAAQIGCLVAAYVIETVGTQEYTLTTSGMLERLSQAYGDQAAADVEPHLRCLRP